MYEEEMRRDDKMQKEEKEEEEKEKEKEKEVAGLIYLIGTCTYLICSVELEVEP